MITHRHIAPLLLVVAVALVTTSARAQNLPDSPGMDKQRMKEFSDIMGKLQATSLLLSLERSRAGQRDRVDLKGNALNPVLAASPPAGPRGSASLGSASVEVPEGVSKCVNPPGQKRARYVVAFVNVAPRVDPLSGGASGFKLDEEELAETVAERFMPQKLDTDQPGVAMVVNLGENEWAHYLDDAWPSSRAANRWIEMTLGDDIDHEAAACELAQAVESLLEQAESSSVSDVLQRKQLRDRLREIRSQFDELRSTVDSGASDTVVYGEQIDPALDTADGQLRRAEQALEQGRFKVASNALKRANEHSSIANSTYIAWVSLETAAREMQIELDRQFDETEFRRTSWLPDGARLDQKLRSCEQDVLSLQELIRDGAAMDVAADQRLRAERCLQEFRDMRASTRERFDLFVFYVPGGLASGIFFLLAILLGRRRGRRETLQYELAPTLSEWQQMVPMLERRLERFQREHEKVLGGDEARALDEGLTREDVDIIDRAFALCARSRAILDEVEQLQSEASTWAPGALEDALALLTDASTELTTSNTADVTPIRRGVRQRETVEHRGLLDLADELTRRIDSRLDELESNELESNEPDSPQAW